MNWIVEGVVGRRAQFSTVVVYQTNDPKRFEQFLSYCEKARMGNGSKEPLVRRVLVFFVWRGLYEVVFGGDKIKFKPVAPQQGGSNVPLPLPMGGSVTAIKSLEMALDYVDNLFRTEEKVWFIIHGVFQRNEVLTSALRYWTFDSEVYERGHAIFVFTESPAAIFDEETLKYFNYVRVPASTEEERKTVLESVIMGLAQEGIRIPMKRVGELVHATAGLNLHEVESVAMMSIYKFGDLKPEALAEYKNDIIRKSGILDIEAPEHGFEAVGGYEVLKQFIRDNVIKILQNPKKAERLGLRPPRGLLLFGMGGTGKTHFARALAKELKLPFLRLRTENIVSKYYGETERSMARALELAEEIAPCVLFIDEIDRFGQRGQLGEHEATRRTFSILLEWLGDARRKTIVIGTTNRPEDLDEAFIRVGRFDYIVPMLLPDKEARKQILEVHTKVIRKVPLSKNVDLDEIADRTEYFTGAELEELVLRAARNALKNGRDKVATEDFEVALETFRINFDARKEQLSRYVQLAERFCNDAEFLQNLMREQKLSSRLEAFKRELQL